MNNITKKKKEKSKSNKKTSGPQGLGQPSPHLSIKKNLTPYVPVELAAPGGQVVPEHIAVADGPPMGDDLVCVKDPEVAVAPVRLASGAGLAQVVATDRSTGKSEGKGESERRISRFVQQSRRG